MAKVKKKSRQKTLKKLSLVYLQSLQAAASSSLFRALIKIGLILILVTFFKSFFVPKDQFQQVKEDILQDPRHIEARLELIEIYLKNNQFAEAEDELKKLESLEGAKNLDSVIAALWQIKYQEDPKELEKQTNQWEKLLASRPDYRDGWLKLTLLYLKLGENGKAQKALETALSLSPNYEITKELEKFIQKK